jgi:hypothetical protein
MVNTIAKRPGIFLENAIFYFSLLFLAAAIGAFFYYRNAIMQSNDELTALAVQKNQSKTEEQGKLEKEISSARRKLADFSKVVVLRRSSLEFFGQFENLALNGIYYTSCNLNLKDLKAGLAGHSRDFQDLGRQSMRFFSGDVAGFSLSKAALVEKGGVDFELNMALDPKTVNFK